MGKARFKAAIIGAGNIGFGFSLDPLRKWPASHLQAYKEHSDFKPVAICDIDRVRLDKAGKYAAGIHTYRSWTEMLKKEEIDILSVCVSPEFNARICGSPLLAKVKALILEKPLAANLRESVKIVNHLNSRDIIAVVNYFRRWQETLHIARELIDSGAIGKIVKICGFYPAGLYTGGSHMIDAATFLLGDFSEVKTLGKFISSKKGDALYTFFGRILGIEAYFSGLDKSNYNIFEMEVWGTKGKLRIYDFCSKIAVFEARASLCFCGQKELFLARKIEVKDYNLYFRNLLDHMSLLLKGKIKKPICAPVDALKTSAVIEAVVASDASGGREVNLKKELFVK